MIERTAARSTSIAALRSCAVCDVVRCCRDRVKFIFYDVNNVGHDGLIARTDAENRGPPWRQRQDKIHDICVEHFPTSVTVGMAYGDN